MQGVQWHGGLLSHPQVLISVENLLTDFQAPPFADFLLASTEMSVFLAFHRQRDEFQVKGYNTRIGALRIKNTVPPIP